MSRIVVIFLLILTFGADFAITQPNPARLRIVQLAFLDQGDDERETAVDIFLDDALLFEAIAFPFITAYVNVPAGNHTLIASPANAPAHRAAFALTLQAGERYTVIVDGEYATTTDPAFYLIPETDRTFTESTSPAIIVNLQGKAVDFHLQIDLVVENLAHGDFAIVDVPVQYFQQTVVTTGAGDPQDFLNTINIISHAETLLLLVAHGGDNPDDWFMAPYYSTDLTMTEFFATQPKDSPFGSWNIPQVIEALTAILENVESPTLFLPAFPETPFEIRDGTSDSITALLNRHISAEYLPPYAIIHHDSITTLSGHTVGLNFEDERGNRWEIDEAFIRQETLNVTDGMIYLISNLMRDPE